MVSLPTVALVLPGRAQATRFSERRPLGLGTMRRSVRLVRVIERDTAANRSGHLAGNIQTRLPGRCKRFRRIEQLRHVIVRQQTGADSVFYEIWVHSDV